MRRTTIGIIAAFVLGAAPIVALAAAYWTARAHKDATTATLPTCTAALEGEQRIRAGIAGTLTTVCICSGDATTFQWCSQKAVAGAVGVWTCLGGSATVCP